MMVVAPTFIYSKLCNLVRSKCVSCLWSLQNVVATMNGVYKVAEVLHKELLSVCMWLHWSERSACTTLGHYKQNIYDVCLYVAMSLAKICLEIFGLEELRPGCDQLYSEI
jgi:hypothetical protein